MAKPVFDKWVSVDTDNVFEAMGIKFILDSELKEYKVSNKAEYIDGKLNDFSNEAFMEMVRVVIPSLDDPIKFFNQRNKEISNTFISFI